MNPDPSSSPNELVILCVGRTGRSEFREVLPSLEPWGKVISAATLRAAVEQLVRDSLTPDVIVIAQSYPGEFADSQIDRLRGIAPLARLVALLGTWCEGELRSGTPWSGGVRVYWHQWRPQCHRELEHLIAGHESSWSLPPTACEEERCLALAAAPKRHGLGTVEIVTEQYDVFEALSSACRDRNYQTRWRRMRDELPSDAPSVVLFDAAKETDLELARFRELEIPRHVPTIVLADFPRFEFTERFLRAGANAVLSRPFFWEDLFWHFPSPTATKNEGACVSGVRRIRAVGGTQA